MLLLKPRLPRFACHARIAGAGTASMLIRGAIRDVSTSGLCLSTSLPIKKGATLHLSFRLPTGLVEAVGEVRWIKKTMGQPHELGIRFIRIDATATAAIERAIDGEQFNEFAYASA